MLYFITSKGLISEETTKKYFIDLVSETTSTKHFAENLYPLQAFIEIPIMKFQDETDLPIGFYDFSNDTRYYHPTIVGNVIIRKIKKSIEKNNSCVLGNKTHYNFTLQWETINNSNIQEYTLNFCEEYFKFEDVFSIIIPFINNAIKNDDKNLYHHLIVLTRLMNIRDGINALFNPQINSNHISYHPVRKCNLEYEYRTLKASRHYTYQYRVGRDDRESESIQIEYEPAKEIFEKIDNNYLYELLYHTLKEIYSTSIYIGKRKDKCIYTFEAWHDYNYGPSKDDYTIEDDKDLKKELIEAINKTYEKYYNNFHEAYKKYIIE